MNKSNPPNFSVNFHKNILVLGDVMIDRYLTGDVTRISPEAPVPVVLLNNTENRLGGAANVALNVKALGATPFLCSIVGDDEEGRLLKKLLEENDLSFEGILSIENRPTTLKSRILSKNQQLLRLDRETKKDLSKEQALSLFQRIKTIISEKKIEVLVFQDYNKGVLSHFLIEKVLALCKEKGVKTVVDPKHKNFFSYQGVSLFKPNLKEVEVSLSLSLNGGDEEGLGRAAAALRGRLGPVQYIWITLSQYGIYLDSPELKQRIPTQARNVADVCGAGDTVVAVAAAGLAAGMNMPDLLRLANLAGGQVCGKNGVVAVDAAALWAAFQKD